MIIFNIQYFPDMDIFSNSPSVYDISEDRGTEGVCALFERGLGVYERGKRAKVRG